MRTIGDRWLAALASLTLTAGLAACSSASGSAVPHATGHTTQTIITQPCTADGCENSPTDPLAPPPPTCSVNDDPQCTGIYGNGTPCDPYVAACGPGGNPFVFVDPGMRIAAQIATHQPQCSYILSAGTPHKNFHNCYLFGIWVP